MTNTRPLQEAPTKTLREGRNAQSGGLPFDCELFLAELETRRDRVQQLLNLVRLEVGRVNAKRTPLHLSHKCNGVRSIPGAGQRGDR